MTITACRLVLVEMDDVRIQWIARQVCLGLSIKDQTTFEDLIVRDDGKHGSDVSRFLDQTLPEDNSSLLFYSLQTAQKIELKLGEQMLDFVWGCWR